MLRDEISIKVKLFLVGTWGVGKSSFIQAWMGKEFQKSYIATFGVDFAHREFLTSDLDLPSTASSDSVRKEQCLVSNGKDSSNKISKKEKVSVELWDTAGQERFMTITAQQLRFCDGVCICYDITEYDSFVDVSKWLERIQQVRSLKEVSVYILGMKADLEENRSVEYELGKETAEKHGFKFYECSAKTRTNIEEPVKAMVRDCLPSARKQAALTKNAITVEVDPSTKFDQKKCKC